MKTIIGLGNKGEKYRKTRHNIGEHAVTLLAEKMGLTFEYNKHILSNIARNDQVQLVIPDLFMNESGKVLDILYKMKKDDEEYRDLLIVRDDIDMGIGNVKQIFEGGSGGHNGINSINTHLKSKKYTQLKIGVLPVSEDGKLLKPSQDEVNDFVVGKFTPTEWETLQAPVEKAIGIMEEFLKQPQGL